jgi:hypothetical protein
MTDAGKLIFVKKREWAATQPSTFCLNGGY